MRHRVVQIVVLLLATQAGAADLDARAVAFEPAKGRDLVNKCSRPGPGNVTSFWRVAESDIREIENRLVVFVEEQKRRSEFRSSVALNQSLRRYLGLELASGEKVVYIDVSPAEKLDPSFPPDSFGLSMCDGGANYWGVEYLPNTKAFRHLFFDGGGPRRSNLSSHPTAFGGG